MQQWWRHGKNRVGVRRVPFGAGKNGLLIHMIRYIKAEGGGGGARVPPFIFFHRRDL